MENLIAVEFHQEQYHPKEMVTGKFIWRSDLATKVHKIIVSCGWRTEGRGDVDKVEVSSQEFFVDASMPENVYEGKFSLPLPIDVPFSYDGKILRIIWEVQIYVNIGVFRNDKKFFPFRVSPVS